MGRETKSNASNVGRQFTKHKGKEGPNFRCHLFRATIGGPIF